MPRRRELAWPLENQPSTAAVAHATTRPETALEALMQCSPGQEPLPSRDEMLPLRDILADAIESLEPREQWIFDAIFCRKLSLRQLSQELQLSKTHLARDRDQIKEKLQRMLLEHPTIREYLSE